MKAINDLQQRNEIRVARFGVVVREDGIEMTESIFHSETDSIFLSIDVVVIQLLTEITLSERRGKVKGSQTQLSLCYLSQSKRRSASISSSHFNHSTKQTCIQLTGHMIRLIIKGAAATHEYN